MMGEHPDDLPYEELVKKKEREEAEREARALREEAEKLAKHETTDFLKAASSKCYASRAQASIQFLSHSKHTFSSF